jgi:hypothetical protein
VQLIKSASSREGAHLQQAPFPKRTTILGELIKKQSPAVSLHLSLFPIIIIEIA